MLGLGLPGLGICDSAVLGFNGAIAASLPAAWWKMNAPNTATGGQFAHGGLRAVLADAAAGVYASTPDAAAFSHTTQLDFDLDLSLDALSAIAAGITGGSGGYLITKAEGAGNRSWDLAVAPGGQLILRYSSDGTTIPVFGSSTVALSTVLSARQRFTLTVKANANDGAGNRWVEFYINGTLLGTRVTTAGAVTFFDGAESLKVFRQTSNSFPGIIYGMTWRNGIGGAVAASPNFAPQPIGTTAFADTQGNTWTAVMPLVADYSATFAYDGQAKNGAVFGAAGEVGTDLAMTFDGVNDYIQGNAGTLISGQAALSFFGYIKTTSTGKTLLFSQGATKRVTFGIASHVLQAVFNDGTTTDTLAGTVVVDDGMWHEVGFVVSGGKCQLYVDGAVDGANQTITSTIGTPESSTPILCFDNAATYFAGSAQHWRVYQRALSAAEVFSLWSVAALPQTAVVLTNEEASTLTSIQVMLHLDANNFDWSKTLADGSDLRLYAANGVTAVQFWIAAWDTALKVGHVVLLVPSLPVGSTTFYVRGNGISNASLSSYNSTMLRFANDADVYAQYDFHEGAGTALHSTVGAFTTGVTNATWVAGDGGGFGDRLINPRFTGGSHLTFDGATQYAFVPGLLTDAGLPAATITFWLESLSQNSANKVILMVNRYGLVCMQLEFASSNRISMIIFDVDGGSVTLNDIPIILGAFDDISGRRFHIALSWGPAGASVWVDGERQQYNESYTKAPKTVGQQIDGSTGLPAAGLSIGAAYDPRVGLTSQFANIRIDGLTIHSRQLKKAEIDQLRHRVKLHPITTAYERLVWRGIVADYQDFGASFNSQSFQEADMTVIGDKIVMYARAGASGTDTDPNGCRICRIESKDGITWGSLTQILGMGNGGLSTSATNPNLFIDPNDGAYYLYYSGATVTGALFKDLRYATSTDGGLTFTDQGPVTVSVVGAAPSGNHDVIYRNGLYHLVAEYDIGAWSVRYWTGSSPRNFSTSVAYPIANAAMSDEGTSGGPDIHILDDGRVALLLHSDVPSVNYLRTGVSFGALTWGFYDNVNLMRQGDLTGDPTGVTNQFADPCAVEFNGSTFIYLDYIVGGSHPASIGCYSYAGSFSDLVRHSVRARGYSARR